MTPFSSSELVWTNYYNGNSGTNTYTITIDDLDLKKVYYFVYSSPNDVTTTTHVSSISNDGIYEDILSFGYYNKKMGVIKVEKASFVTFTTRLNVTNGDIYFVSCAV